MSVLQGTGLEHSSKIRRIEIPTEGKWLGSTNATSAQCTSVLRFISIVHPVLQFDSRDKTLLRCDEVFLTSTVLRQMKLMFTLNFRSGIRSNTVIFYLKFSTGWARDLSEMTTKQLC